MTAKQRTLIAETPRATVAPSDELLDSANAAQREAITHATGPLLVVAGAGTGKTSVLTKRIAWLIREGHAKPNEILALTFTEKAAGEMETRVDQLLPYGATGTVVATYHSFGDQLLRTHALDLGLPPEFRVLGSDEQRLFLEERIDDIEGLIQLRPVASSRKYVSAALSVISRAKDELVSAKQYTQVAAQLQASAKTDEEKAESQKQQEIALIYASYEQFKAEKGVIDFGDQILKLVELFTARPSVLTRIQQQFKFVMVDEFQDTNVAQYELVKRIVAPHQNLCVVGDDDQAIYKFRGAATSNILGFKRDFPTTKTVVLTENYRSTQAILDASYTLVQHNNPDRLEHQLQINKQLTGLQQGVPPRFVWYKHEADELDGLVAALAEIRKTVALDNIAILVRNNSLVSSLATACTTADIPYVTSSDKNFVNLPEIRGVIAFYIALTQPTNSLAYMKLALSPFYDIDPAWMLPFNDLSRKENKHVFDIMADEGHAAWTRLPDEGKTAIAELRDNLMAYRQKIGEHNPGQLLYQFLKDRDVLDGTGRLKSMDEERRMAMIQNLAAVFEAIQGYIETGRDTFSLAFVDQLDSLLPNITPPRVNLGPDADAVQILTVHAAKGLEFDTVFLPFMTSDRFPARAKHDPLELPAELIAETLPTGDEHLQEERRLAYVACTRAKTRLLISGASLAGAGKRLKKPSPFVLEALELTSLPDPVERVQPAARVNRFAPVAPRPTTLSFPIYNDQLSLTPAMIDTYLRDPYDFFWKYVLKAPMLPSSHLSYGNAIHAAIEAYYRKRLSDQPATIEDILRRFSEAWSNEGYVSLIEANRRHAAGEETLRRFLRRADAESLPSMVEETFTLNLPGVRIRGRMDAIFKNSGEIRDFKTSHVTDQKDANKKVRENLPIRIYALAYQNRFKELPKSLTLDFVEANLRASIEPDATMLESITTTIAEVADNIRANRFPANPDNPFKEYD
ncbi:MAG: ATP-dependent DNA helicase [Patescibacteria group bacterium]